ncbi:MAG TPA: response regulator [Bryobacteraceae bacterium]|nr:response regulator [Bryobacteraceae bacterium]
MDPSLLIMVGGVLFAALAGYFLGRRSPAASRESPRAGTSGSETSVQQLFADAPIGYLEIDREGIVQWVNACECALRGLPKEQIVGKAYWELKEGDQQQLVQQSFSSMLASDSDVPCRDQYVRPDGRIVIADVYKHRLMDRNGRVSGIRFASADITENTRAEQEVVKTTQELKAIFDAFPDSFVRLDAKHVVLDYKGSQASDLDLKMPGRRVEETLAGEAGERIGKAVDQVIRTHTTVAVEFPLTVQGQPQFFEARLALVNWTEVIALIRNVTDRKAADDQLKEFAQELQHKNDQLADALIAAREVTRFKTRFLANMSHEIRTPMNGVLGMTELLLETPLSEEQSDYARSVSDSCHALISLVDDVLDLSKMESGKFAIENVAFDLRDALERVMQPHVAAAQVKGVEMVADISADLPHSVRGDPGRFRQVLGNLLGNAVKFTDKGRISLRAELAGQMEGAFTLRFVIKDTGIGVTPEQIPSLFESFVQVDNSSTRHYGGTGLGLAIAKQLVEIMRGEIGAESTPGQGSTFWFTAVFEKQEAERAVDTQPPLDLKKYRVLLLEDSASERVQIRARLEAWGAICEELAAQDSSPVEVLRNAASNGRPFDIVLLAMDMQGQDGLVIGHAIKSDPQVGNAILIGLTGPAKRGHGPVLRAVGFDGHVQKPVLAADLRDTIGEAIATAEKRAGISPVLRPPEKPRTEHRRTGSSRILLVEDDDVNQKYVLRVLQRNGIHADLAIDGRRAVDAVMKSDYDLVLMDVQMPRMDGLEATAQIRFREGTNRHTPIVGLTANALPGDRERCLAAGMDDYLSKPVSVEQLKNAIGQWVGEDALEPEKHLAS